MKLDINEIYHQYITRVVIFALFAYKRLVKQPGVYRLSVNAFVKKRLPWDINLEIDMGIQLDKEDQRDIVLEEILNDVESDYMTSVTVSFTTPMKGVSMVVDLREEEKYQNFLYI
jgi:hypothetical protein